MADVIETLHAILCEASGDTMCGAATGASLYTITGNPLWLLVGVWAAFGRVYWWAHWALDVTGGFIIGTVSVYITRYFTDGSRTGLMSVMAIMLFLCWMKLLKHHQTKIHRYNSERNLKEAGKSQ